MRDCQNLIESLRYCATTAAEKCETCPRINHKECNLHDFMLEEADAVEELLAENKAIKQSNKDAAMRNKLLCDEISRMKEKLPHWISVEERLPEPYQNVLTCAWKLFGPDRRRVYGIDYTLDNGEWACGGESYKTMVTHWMPLPKPPKEEA